MAIRKRISIENIYWSEWEVLPWEYPQALQALKKDRTNHVPIPVVECRDLRAGHDGYAVVGRAAWAKAAHNLGLAEVVCLVQTVAEAETDPECRVKFVQH